MTERARLIAKRHAARSRLSPERIAYDIVFVLNVNSKGWILEKICRVIAEASGLHCRFVFSETNDTISVPLPAARAYFFAHYSLAFFAMLREPIVFQARRFVWFTHPDPAKGIGFDEVAAMAAASDTVFVANAGHRDLLETLGVPPERVSLVLGGADPDAFTPSPRGQGAVGIVGAYYPRKRPELLAAVIEANPDIPFVLVAPRAEDVVNQGILWEAWEGFARMKALPNLRYEPAPYEAFGDLYDGIDILLSLSDLEGGPIPIIEALMSNALVVATDTGFARDVIEDGVNGRVLPRGPDVAAVGEALAWARAETARDVAAPARRDLSWAAFGAQVAGRMFADPGEARVSFAEGGPGEDLLQGDWSAPDPTGTRAGGPRAAISASVAGGVHARRFYVWPTSPDADARRVQIASDRGDPRDYALREAPSVLSHVFAVPEGRAGTVNLTLIGAPPGPDEAPYRGTKIGWTDAAVLEPAGPGDEVGFGAEEAGRFCLESGWHAAERGGCWSFAPARVVLPLSEALREAGFDLVLRVSLPGGGGGTATARLPGGAEVREAAEGGKPASLRLRVEPGRAPALLEVALASDAYVVPAERGGSTDRRSLGLKLHRASFEPLSPAPEAVRTTGQGPKRRRGFLG